METFRNTIDNDDYKLNTVIDTDIISFKFYDKHYYNQYSSTLNDEFILNMYSITFENFKKIIIHCLSNNENIKICYKNTQIQITFEFSEIINMDFTIHLNKDLLESIESSKIAIKEIENKFNQKLQEIQNDFNQKLEQLKEFNYISIGNSNYILELHGTTIKQSGFLTEYMTYYKTNCNLKIVVRNGIYNGFSSLCEDNYETIVISDKHVRYNQNLYKLNCTHFAFETNTDPKSDANLLNIIHYLKSSKTVEILTLNSIYYNHYIKNIGMLNIENLKILILVGVNNTDYNNNTLLLNTSIKEIHLKNSVLENCACFEGKIIVKNI